MADGRSTLLECSVKIRQGRKWKSRWCVMTRQSPVSAEVILKFYKDQSALVRNKELSRERVCISAEKYCGLECGFRHPKNTYVLTIILSDAVILLSFPAHERLLEWYHRIKNTLPSENEFHVRVSIPGKGKLPSGKAALYFYNTHFAITPETPLKLFASWDLSKVYRYGIFEGGFAFSVISSKGSVNHVNHVLLLPNPEYIKNHFDAAMSAHLPSRWSTHSDLNPASRDDFQSTSLAEVEQLLSDDGKQREDEGQQSTTERTGERNKVLQPSETDALLSQFPNSANSNPNTQKHSDSGFTDLDKDSIELALLENLRRNSQPDTPSVGLIQETVFGNGQLHFRPQNTPFREQEYEVMASFDHYRSSLHEEVDLGSQMTLSHENDYGQSSFSGFYSLGQGEGGSNGRRRSGFGGGGDGGMRRIQHLLSMDRFRLDLTPDKQEYVNLPSPTSAISNTVHNSLRLNKKKFSIPHLPMQRITVEAFDFSPPSSPPPPPPIIKSRTDIKIYSKENVSVQGLAPGSEITAKVPDTPVSSVPSLFPDSEVEAPIPFMHEELVKPVGPMARLKRNSSSQDSENASFIASGSEFGDSSNYSSATNSRHNSYDRDAFQWPPPIPPKPASLRIPSIDALLSSENFRNTPSLIERLLSEQDILVSPSTQDSNVPPIPPKPDYMRGKPFHKEPSTPRSPTGRPPFLPPRKRFNTVPSFSLGEGDTEWVETRDGEGDEGYLIMKPAYEDKLRGISVAHTRSKSVPDEESVCHSLPSTMPRTWTIASSSGRASMGTSPRSSVARLPQSPSLLSAQSPLSEFGTSPGQRARSPTVFAHSASFPESARNSIQQWIPQSPIHDSDTSDNMRVRTLKRSATIGVFRQQRTSRSPSFTGKRPSLVRRSLKQRRGSESTTTSRTSDISMGSIRMVRKRRQDRYGSLDHRSMSLGDYKSEDSSLDIPESPTARADPAFNPDDLAHLKDEYAGNLPLSPPSSANTSPRLSPVSSIESLNQPEDSEELEYTS